MASNQGSTAFLDAMKNLFAWRPVAEDRIEPLLKQWRPFFEEIGETAFTGMVRNLVESAQVTFFPSIPEARSYVPKRRIVYCGQAGCVDGFRYVPDYEARRLYGNDTAMSVRKCGCARLV